MKSDWYVVDATDQVLGRLAAKIAMIVQGKNKPTYTPHVDTGDFVIVLNAEKVKVTGKKAEVWNTKPIRAIPAGGIYIHTRPCKQLHPEKLLQLAVRRMLPKSKMGRNILDQGQDLQGRQTSACGAAAQGTEAGAIVESEPAESEPK